MNEKEARDYILGRGLEVSSDPRTLVEIAIDYMRQDAMAEVMVTPAPLDLPTQQPQ